MTIDAVNPNPDDKTLAALLSAHRVYPTAQRLMVARILFARHQHATADGLLHALHAAGQRVSKATVYNTLARFVEAGLLREVIVDNQHTFYDSNTRPHHHFYNLDSGELTDVNIATPLAVRDHDLPAGTTLDSVDIVIRIRNAAG